ncbi:hypothetical protein [Chitinophaga sp. sic0106]|uniref:hypothetical protein n=1 Tax=Chitinophaga sp. sic0106 TaxID=2854785 RepID=UPI001C48EBB9|nr:hypothetical protein [Chitinophaga sp. sic0106]MBV7531612.1 hypothetical protein [Chitinophaga sp. sic0106]
MKTSTKLIIGFLGILIFLMLVTDITIWANYKKGITNQEWIGAHHNKNNPEENKKILPVTVQPFKVLVVFNTNVTRREYVNADSTEREGIEEVRQHNKVEVVQEDAWSVTSYNGDQFKQNGDTLMITLTAGSGGFKVAVGKEMPQIINTAAWMEINGVQATQLVIVADTSARTVISNVGIGELRYTGGRRTRLEMFGNTAIDNADISFTDGGSINLNDVYFKQHHFNFDEKVEVSLNGKSVKMISGQQEK